MEDPWSPYRVYETDDDNDTHYLVGNRDWVLRGQKTIIGTLPLFDRIIEHSSKLESGKCQELYKSMYTVTDPNTLVPLLYFLPYDPFT